MSHDMRENGTLLPTKNFISLLLGSGRVQALDHSLGKFFGPKEVILHHTKAKQNNLQGL